MTGFLWLVPVALAMGIAGLAAFVWSLGARQYDDPDGNAARILADDDRPSPIMAATISSAALPITGGTWTRCAS